MDEALKKIEVQPPVKTDAYTEELFKKIKDENIIVDPTVWSLLTMFWETGLMLSALF